MAGLDFEEVFQDAAVREGVDELTLPRGEEGTQASCKGVEEAECDNLYYKFVDMNQAVNVRHPSGNSRANIKRDAARQESWGQHLQNPSHWSWRKPCGEWRCKKKKR